MIIDNARCPPPADLLVCSINAYNLGTSDRQISHASRTFIEVWILSLIISALDVNYENLHLL
jgi:hypothetical protein